MAHGFCDTMTDKVDIILDAIRSYPGEPFVFTDCDVQFFGTTKAILLDAIDDCDIAAQADSNNQDVLCAGFFVCKANDTALHLFDMVKRGITSKKHDQMVLNECLDVCHWKTLNKDQFWSPRKFWKPNKPLDVPPNILMHHANWTIGVAHKIKMLEQVRDLTNRRNQV
jgi:hypothetical protein